MCAGQALWGLPDKKSKGTPPKCFNIASRVQKSSIEQPLSCRVHPVTVLKILDAYVRRPAGATRTIGTLLGWISEGNAVDITDSFPVPHKENDEGVSIDQDYHKSMLELRQKVSPREVVVGWFSTGDEINAASSVIHAFYCKKEASQFNPTAVLPGPLHFLIDATPGQQNFAIKTFVNVRTTVAENLLQFHEVPLRVQTSAAEKSSISQLMHARRANREAQASGNAKDMASLDGLQGGLKELLGLSRRIQQYVRAVQSGEMHIEEVIIDGFKSYSTRVPVGPFDRQFNAITGLNGSGKSNILDSICFVLGISNLTQVRVGNLSELVYKQGQAGVTKASVTIVFNNQDKQNSPVGYEMHDKIIITRQIVIGGRNRYLLNGHNVQQNQIQNLFHSVSLKNVNNPHFLIMQGRITKVINMKPQETLSMIEEAAGTRMYENKKAGALKTLEKKQNKVDEINRLLSEEITPTLEKLQKERSNYMLWVSNNNEIERLERFCVAYEYVGFKNRLENKNQQLEEMEESLAQIAAGIKELTARDKAIEKEIKQRTASRDKARSQELKELEDKQNKLSKDIASMESKLKNKQAELDSEKEHQKKSSSGMGELRKQLQQKEAVYEKEKSKYEKLTQEESAAQKEIEKAQWSMQAVTAGMAETSTEGEQRSVREQLLHAQTRLQEMQAEEKTKTMAIANLKERIARAEQNLGNSKQDGQALGQGAKRPGGRGEGASSRSCRRPLSTPRPSSS
ncbi:unnamed protein product [Effrenium voratum]|nr:unnamed protein product [Effrenium voratum]